MNKTDNSLRAQTIMLAMKALEVVSKALDIIAADEATDDATNISNGTDTNVSHGTDTELTRKDTDISHRGCMDVSHGTDTELTRKDTDEIRRDTDISHGTNTDEKRKDTGKSLCAATPLPSRGGAGGGVCISLTDKKLCGIYGAASLRQGAPPGVYGWYAKQIQP